MSPALPEEVTAYLVKRPFDQSELRCRTSYVAISQLRLLNRLIAVPATRAWPAQPAQYHALIQAEAGAQAVSHATKGLRVALACVRDKEVPDRVIPTATLDAAQWEYPIPSVSSLV